MNAVDSLALPLPEDRAAIAPRRGLRDVLGPEAWTRLPQAVRERFGDAGFDADYLGAFEIVRASLLGRAVAWLAQAIGTPIAPRTGLNVAARVRVRHGAGGVSWQREYHWADGASHSVSSTKAVTPELRLIEKLPARLCMPLRVFESGGVLHFVSEGYYFDVAGMRIPLPLWLTPGQTHVEHVDLGHGWFRFTMDVAHPWFGETYFQTGRFCATDDDTP